MPPQEINVIRSADKLRFSGLGAADVGFWRVSLPSRKCMMNILPLVVPWGYSIYDKRTKQFLSRLQETLVEHQEHH